MKAIGIRHPSNSGVPEQFEINGRFYEIDGSVQANGAYRLYPVRGNGLLTLGRVEYKALLQLIEHGGRTLECESQFAYDPEIDSAIVETALRVYQMRRQN